jgi:hypothetical protein
MLPLNSLMPFVAVQPVDSYWHQCNSTLEHETFDDTLTGGVFFCHIKVSVHVKTSKVSSAHCSAITRCGWLFIN